MPLPIADFFLNLTIILYNHKLSVRSVSPCSKLLNLKAVSETPEFATDLRNEGVLMDCSL